MLLVETLHAMKSGLLRARESEPSRLKEHDLFRVPVDEFLTEVFYRKMWINISRRTARATIA
jgi:hypothetical protein